MMIANGLSSRAFFMIGKKFNCPYCFWDEIFESQFDLEWHILKRHGKSIFISMLKYGKGIAPPKYTRENNLNDSDNLTDYKNLKVPENRVVPTLIPSVRNVGFVEKPCNHCIRCCGLVSDFRTSGVLDCKPFLIREQRSDNYRSRREIRRGCIDEPENFTLENKDDFSFVAEPDNLTVMDKAEPSLGVKKVQSYINKPESLIITDEDEPSLGVEKVQSCIDESEKLLAMENGESSLDAKKVQSYVVEPESLMIANKGEPSSSIKIVQSCIDESETLLTMEKGETSLDVKKVQSCIDESETLLTMEKGETSLNVKKVQSYIDEPENLIALEKGEFSLSANRVRDTIILGDTSTLERVQQIPNIGAMNETRSNNNCNLEKAREKPIGSCLQICAQKCREASKSRCMTSQSFSTDTNILKKDGLACKNEAVIIVENSPHEENRSNEYGVGKVAAVDNCILSRSHSNKNLAPSKNELAEQNNPSLIVNVGSAKICRESDTHVTDAEKFPNRKLKKDAATYEKKCAQCFQDAVKSDNSQNSVVHCLESVNTERQADEVISVCMNNQESEMITKHGNLVSSSFMQNMTESQKNGNCCITIGDISLHFGENDIIKLHKKGHKTSLKKETIELQEKIEELLDRFHVNSTMVGRTGNVNGISGERVAKVNEKLMNELKKVLIEENDKKRLDEQWKIKWLDLDDKLRKAEQDNSLHKTQYRRLVNEKEELEAVLSAANEKLKYFQNELNRRDTEALREEEKNKLLESLLKEKEQALEEMVDFDAKGWQDVCDSVDVKKEDMLDETMEESSISHNAGVLSCFFHFIRRVKKKRKRKIKMKMISLTFDELDEEIRDLRKKLFTEKRKCALLVLLKEERVCELELYKEKTTMDATTLENMRKDLEIANSTWQMKQSHQDGGLVQKLSKEYSMLSQQNEYSSKEMIGLKNELQKAAWSLKFADSYNAEMEGKLRNCIYLLRKRVEKEKKERKNDVKLFSFRLEEKDRQLGVLKAELNAERNENKNLMTRCED